MGGKERERTVEGFAGEHVLFLETHLQKSTKIYKDLHKGRVQKKIVKSM